MDQIILFNNIKINMMIIKGKKINMNDIENFINDSNYKFLYVLKNDSENDSENDLVNCSVNDLINDSVNDSVNVYVNETNIL